MFVCVCEAVGSSDIHGLDFKRDGEPVVMWDHLDCSHWTFDGARCLALKTGDILI